ncbi:MAG TPA: T9SS type A sorting domain-containing protein [Chryseosolibacter sp.]
MRFFLLLIFVGVGHTLYAQQIYLEDFADNADNGQTSGSAVGGTWSTTPPATSDDWEQDADLEAFLASDLSAEGVWRTNAVTINTSYFSIEVVGGTALTEPGDYLTGYYSINGGAEIQFYSLSPSLVAITGGGSVVVPITPGSTVQVIFRIFCGDNFEYFAIDDVSIGEITNLYSAVSGNWNTGGTWSTDGIGGTPCPTCIPDEYTREIIGAGHIIDINSPAIATDIEIQDGTLRWTANADLNVVKGGVITVSGTSTLTANGFTNAQIDYDNGGFTYGIVNNGVCNIGDIDINDEPTILNLSGANQINVVNDLLIDGTTTISGTNSLQAGTLSVTDGTTTLAHTGGFSITGASTIDAGTALVDSDNTGVTLFGGLLTVNGTFTSSSITTESNLVFRGGITLAGTFSAGGATFNTNNQSLNGTAGTYNFANTVTITGVNLTNNRTVSISNTSGDRLIGSGTWIQGNNSTLNYAGTTLGVTAFQASNTGNTVVYNNTTTAQTLRMPATNYYNLTFNNTSATIPQLVMSASMTVANGLTLTSGVVNLNGNTLTLGASGSASTLTRTASTSTNWLYGGTFVRSWPTGQTPSPTTGNLYGLFPMGHSTASSYRPVQITGGSNVTTTGSVSVNHVNATTVTDLNPTYDDAGTAIVRKHDAQFNISVTGVAGGTNYQLRVTMTDLLAGTAANIRLAKSNGATTVTNVGTHFATAGSASNPTARRNGINSVAGLTGDWRITTTNITATPLPIELNYFNAVSALAQVNLEWETASEHNNASFTVEKTRDFETFFTVGEVGGKGDSRTPSRYSLVDHFPFNGKCYYRLKQTDFDGKFTYSNPVMILFEDTQIPQLALFPNPANEKTPVRMVVSNLDERNGVPVKIFNQQGQLIFETLLTDENKGFYETELPLGSLLSKGIYVVKAGRTLALTRKLLVE